MLSVREGVPSLSPKMALKDLQINFNHCEAVQDLLINFNHCEAVQDLLIQTVREDKVDVAIIAD